MPDPSASFGQVMAAEIAEAPEVFARAALADHRDLVMRLGLAERAALYTIARGSSDAAANIVAYEAMRELQVPVTSLPPSVFSVGQGLRLQGSGAVLISQSGASEDLVLCAQGVVAQGSPLVAITNAPGSPVEAVASATIAISAGPELAVPATKTVIGSIAAGIAMLSALRGDYAQRTQQSVASFQAAKANNHPILDALREGLLQHHHIYVVGRDVGFGAAQEVALKIKETCALQAEAFSSSEVLHGPLQLATRSMLVLMLDADQPQFRQSLDIAQSRFLQAGVVVHRIRASDLSGAVMTPAASAAYLLFAIYSVIRQVAVALGYNPDAPSTLNKVTTTR